MSGTAENQGNSLTYTVDADDRIEKMGGNWNDFAAENAAPEMQEPANVVGTSIWSFLAGTEIKSLFRQIFEEVRVKETTFSMPFRCDSPDVQREMMLTVSYAGDNKLDISTVLQNEMSQPHVPLFSPRSYSTRNHINRCSVCRRFEDRNGDWLSATELAMKTSILAAPHLPAVSERVCGECADLAGASYLVSRSGHAEDEPENVPLVVFLHGAAHQKYLMRLNAPPRLVAQNKLAFNPPFLLLSLLDNKNGKWSSEKIIEQVWRCCTEYSVDCTRIYITGVSKGGIAVWDTICEYPDIFAAAVPVAAYNVSPFFQSAGALPVWAVHGGCDSVLSPKHFLRSMDRISGYLPNLKWTMLPDREHDAWSWTYSNPDVWAWMFSQSRMDSENFKWLKPKSVVSQSTYLLNQSSLCIDRSRSVLTSTG